MIYTQPALAAIDELADLWQIVRQALCDDPDAAKIREIREIAVKALFAAARISHLLAEVADLDDGTDVLGVVIRQAIRDDPDVTAADIRAIIAEAIADASVVRAGQQGGTGQ